MTFLYFLIVFGALIFVHELGHFLLAKRSGMRVEEFGFGFPPRLFGIKRGDTVYSINLIPFGGFVKIYGEDGGHRKESGSFGSKTFSQRMKVILAGVVMNFLFAVLLLGIGNWLGLRIAVTDDERGSARDIAIQIVQVISKSPAADAGVQPLDAIVGVRDSSGALLYLEDISQVQEFTNSNSGDEITMVLRRGGEVIERKMIPRKDPPPNEGPTGLVLVLTGTVTHPWYEAPWRGFRDASVLTLNILYGYGSLLKSLFINGQLIGEVAGPVGIATFTGQAAQAGFRYLIQFVAVISLNLMILNIMPFPALDGGRAFMLIIEKVRGVPLDKRVENMINTTGFLILLTLMFFLTVRDIGKLL